MRGKSQALLQWSVVVAIGLLFGLPFAVAPHTRPISTFYSEFAAFALLGVVFSLAWLLKLSSRGETGGVAVAVAAPAVVSAQRNEPAISPRARRAARELGVDWVTLAGSGSSGRIVERDVRAYAASMVAPVTNGKGRATPSVRRLAEERGVDLNVVAGSAPGGRITRSDVELLVASAPREGEQPGDRSAPMSTVRRLTAQRG